MRILLLILIGAGLAACDDAPDNAAADQGLFTHQDRHVPSSAKAGATSENGVLRYRLVSLDTASLLSADPTSKQILKLNLFADVVISAELDPAPATEGEVAFRVGHVVGDETSLVTLLLRDQQVFVNVRLSGRFYRVRPDQGHLYRVEEIAPVNLPGHLPAKSK